MDVACVLMTRGVCVGWLGERTRIGDGDGDREYGGSEAMASVDTCGSAATSGMRTTGIIYCTVGMQYCLLACVGRARE